MRTDRLALVERAVFERMALAFAGIGAAAGTAAVAAGTKWVTAPLLTCGIATVGLLAASTLRGRDDTLAFPARLLLLGAALVVGFATEGTVGVVLALGAFTGLAMAGPAPGWKRAVGFGAGAAGTAWALAVLPRLEAMWGGWPVVARAIALGTAAGVLFGVPLLALHVRVHPDALAARLTDERLQRLWARVHAALAGAPRAVRGELLAVLGRTVGSAAQRSETLAVLDARLRAADRKDAEAQLAQLKADADAATDATARQRLTSAAASLGDSLEALDTLDRKRERLEAEVRLSLAVLERSAMAIETAQGAPDELRAVALRLQQQDAAA